MKIFILSSCLFVCGCSVNSSLVKVDFPFETSKPLEPIVIDLKPVESYQGNLRLTSFGEGKQGAPFNVGVKASSSDKDDRVVTDFELSVYGNNYYFTNTYARNGLLVDSEVSSKNSEQDIDGIKNMISIDQVERKYPAYFLSTELHEGYSTKCWRAEEVQRLAVKRILSSSGFKMPNNLKTKGESECRIIGLVDFKDRSSVAFKESSVVEVRDINNSDSLKVSTSGWIVVDVKTGMVVASNQVIETRLLGKLVPDYSVKMSFLASEIR